MQLETYNADEEYQQEIRKLIELNEELAKIQEQGSTDEQAVNALLERNEEGLTDALQTDTEKIKRALRKAIYKQNQKVQEKEKQAKKKVRQQARKQAKSLVAKFDKILQEYEKVLAEYEKAAKTARICSDYNKGNEGLKLLGFFPPILQTEPERWRKQVRGAGYEI